MDASIRSDRQVVSLEGQEEADLKKPTTPHLMSPGEHIMPRLMHQAGFSNYGGQQCVASRRNPQRH